LDDAEVRCSEYDCLYPVNTLRNVALTAAHADLVFLLDVDFLPSEGLRARICGDDSSKLLRTLQQNKSALIVPAFEVSAGTKVPHKQSELEQTFNAGKAEGFHIRSFPSGHRATNLDDGSLDLKPPLLEALCASCMVLMHIL